MLVKEAAGRHHFKGYKLAWPVWTVTLVAVLGCGSGDGLDRCEVSGIVYFRDQPLAEGSILLEPSTEEVGTATGATIHEGLFRIGRSLGPVEGNYTVRIYAGSTVQAPLPKGDSKKKPRPMVELIPVAYNTQTTLRVVVSKQKANRFRFDLEPTAP